jgi:hypothetical protein
VNGKVGGTLDRRLIAVPPLKNDRGEGKGREREIWGN